MALAKDRGEKNMNDEILKAIRQDIKEMRSELKLEIKDLKTPLINLEKKIDSNLKEIRNEIKNDFVRLEIKIDSNFKWLIGTIFGGFIFLLGSIGAVLGTLAKAFHWI